MTDTHTDPLTLAESTLAAGGRCALATVAGTWSSAPVRAGAQMVVTESGAFAGSVSGGCVEADVIAHAAQVMQAGEAKLVHYTVTNDRAWEVGLACGGRMTVYIEPIG